MNSVGSVDQRYPSFDIYRLCLSSVIIVMVMVYLSSIFIFNLFWA